MSDAENKKEDRKPTVYEALAEMNQGKDATSLISELSNTLSDEEFLALTVKVAEATVSSCRKSLKEDATLDDLENKLAFMYRGSETGVFLKSMIQTVLSKSGFPSPAFIEKVGKGYVQIGIELAKYIKENNLNKDKPEDSERIEAKRHELSKALKESMLQEFNKYLPKIQPILDQVAVGIKGEANRITYQTAVVFASFTPVNTAMISAIAAQNKLIKEGNVAGVSLEIDRQLTLGLFKFEAKTKTREYNLKLTELQNTSNQLYSAESVPTPPPVSTKVELDITDALMKRGVMVEAPTAFQVLTDPKYFNTAQYERVKSNCVNKMQMNVENIDFIRAYKEFEKEKGTPSPKREEARQELIRQLEKKEGGENLINHDNKRKELLLAQLKQEPFDESNFKRELKTAYESVAGMIRNTPNLDKVLEMTPPSSPPPSPPSEPKAKRQKAELPKPEIQFAENIRKGWESFVSKITGKAQDTSPGGSVADMSTRPQGVSTKAASVLGLSEQKKTLEPKPTPSSDTPPAPPLRRRADGVSGNRPTIDPSEMPPSTQAPEAPPISGPAKWGPAPVPPKSAPAPVSPIQYRGPRVFDAVNPKGITSIRKLAALMEQPPIPQSPRSASQTNDSDPLARHHPFVSVANAASSAQVIQQVTPRSQLIKFLQDPDLSALSDKKINESAKIFIQSSMYKAGELLVNNDNPGVAQQAITKLHEDFENYKIDFLGGEENKPIKDEIDKILENALQIAQKVDPKVKAPVSEQQFQPTRGQPFK
jgi:hypothetical protein